VNLVLGVVAPARDLEALASAVRHSIRSKRIDLIEAASGSDDEPLALACADGVVVGQHFVHADGMAAQLAARLAALRAVRDDGKALVALALWGPGAAACPLTGHPALVLPSPDFPEQIPADRLASRITAALSSLSVLPLRDRLLRASRAGLSQQRQRVAVLEAALQERDAALAEIFSLDDVMPDAIPSPSIDPTPPVDDLGGERLDELLSDVPPQAVAHFVVAEREARLAELRRRFSTPFHSGTTT
jgi:hypothetical protein